MDIQNFYLACIFLLFCIQIWRKFIPDEQYLNTTCIVGKINVQSSSKKVIDCSSCLTFPIQTLNKGNIIISTKHQQTQMGDRNFLTEIYAFVYMQDSCIQYNCADLQSKQKFIDNKTLQQNSLTHYKQIIKSENKESWDLSIPFQNRHHQKGTLSAKNRLFNLLLGSILPISFLPYSQYYYGMAIKLRYTVPSEQNLQIQKPLAKVTVNSQRISDYIVLSIILIFTLAIKSSIFTTTRHLDRINFSFAFSFISPFLWSIFSFAMMTIRHPKYIISVLLFVLSILLDRPYLIPISIAFSSFIQYREGNEVLSKLHLILFNSFIIVSFLLDIQTILTLSPSLFYVLNMKSSLEQHEISDEEQEKDTYYNAQTDEKNLQVY